jgi:hypothetical protein
MAYTTIDNPELYFQVKLYTGDGSTPSITLDGDEDMQPDVVWIKNRDATDSHCIFDAVRGATEVLHVDTSALEATDADTLTSFDSDGFALGADDKVNTNTENYVAWCWKESATAGFDIVTATGTGSAHTIAHSLSAVPHLMISKEKSGSINDWRMYNHKNTSAPETDSIIINETSGTEDNATHWNDTAPTSSVFTVGTGSVTNRTDSTYVYYLWTEKQGFSKFGEYTGNGNADGTYVHLGFRPAFLILKRTDGTQGWLMWDNKRLGYNPDNNHLQPHDNDAFGTADTLDLLSNGFKIRESGAGTNGSGNTYIYTAFAEVPFVNSNGVPCNAR